jgi:hypothetical protein
MDKLQFTADELEVIIPSLRFMQELQDFFNPNNDELKQRRSRRVRQDLTRLYLSINRRFREKLLASGDARDILISHQCEESCKQVLELTKTTSTRSTPDILLAIEKEVKKISTIIDHRPMERPLHRSQFLDLFQAFENIWHPLLNEFLNFLKAKNVTLYDNCNVM